jgi:hypothetical protein
MSLEFPMSPLPRAILLAASILLAAGPSAAQDQPVYKCNSHAYSQAPCADAPMGAKRVNKTYKAPPPQDRAKAMNRAQLPPEARKQCASLETTIRAEEARLKAKRTPSDQELGDLAIKRVNYREMRC